MVELRLGGALLIHIDPAPADGRNGADAMHYVAPPPMQMRCLDWNAPPSLFEVRAQSTVPVLRFDLVDQKTTRLHLFDTGWATGGERNKPDAYFDRAWGNVLKNLEQRFASGKPDDRANWIFQLEVIRANGS